MPTANPEIWMREAIKEAEAAQAEGEVPVGAVVVFEGRVVGRGHNQVEQAKDATSHAEILAIQEASKHLGNWRLSNSAIFVTLEPCSMCIGALLLSRVSELYFGCYDPRQGAVGSLFDLSNNSSLPHQVTVFPEVLAKECSALLQSFFVEQRRLAKEKVQESKCCSSSR
jgi:tRNA(adenine34) deaminase